MNSFKRQYHIKILASALLIVLSLSMLVMVTFAWYVMSTAPEVSGMQIKIGSDTIRVAPDCKDESGQHYPGAFQGVLETDTTAIPEDFWGLIPVSTADGKHWFSATYESLENGGDQKEEYLEDTTLSSANLTTRPKSGGNYLYLDFWVVAPKDYDLRVSTATQGSGQSGSYVKVFPQVKMDAAGHYSLDETQRQAESSLRIGFLVNEDVVSGESYKNSDTYDTAYKILKGVYQEQGKELPTSQTSFTIYEPNCDWHADTQFSDQYKETKPLALGVDGKPQPVTLESVQTKLAAQTSATWTLADDGKQTKLAQALQTALLDAKTTNRSVTNAQSAGEYLLNQYLKGQLSGYITSGQFVKSTRDLQDGVRLDKENIEKSGAADDAVIVSLKKNVPQRIRMFVWLEGEDIDCTNEAALKTLLLNLELAGETKQ